MTRENYPDSFPASMRHLGPFDQSGQRECPECGTHYQVTYQLTIEDLSWWEDIEVRRDVSKLADPELLEHSEAYVRQDAAFALARAGRPELGLRHADPLVRRSTLSALDVPADLRFLLDDEDGPTRQRAAGLSLVWLLERKDTSAMIGLLRDHPADVRNMAIAYLDQAEGLDVTRLAPALEKWSTRQDLAGLEWLARQGYQRELQVERLLEASRQPDPDIRRAAVTSLDNLQSLWTPAVLRRLLELLKSDPPCRYAILLSLQKPGRELDLRPFLPVIASFLASQDFSHFPNAATVLQRRIQLGEGNAELGRILKPGLTVSNAYHRSLVDECYQALAAAGF